MIKILVFIAFLLFLAACSGAGGSSANSNSGGAGGEPVSVATAGTPSGQEAINGVIHVNQMGFMPESIKIAVVANTNTDSDSFELINVASQSVVMRGSLSGQQIWNPSGENVKLADFTALTTPGEYRIRVNNIASTSPVFRVDNNVFAEVHKATLKAYYFNRSSTVLDPQFASVWSREAGHPDTEVIIDDRAATISRPAGSSIAAPKGWYDAGDFNKYVVNSGISTYTLLAAYEQFDVLYETLDTNIPESGDQVPDILDEVKWNLDWMLNMQDEDGGVYHKLTHERFSGQVLPSLATAPRYVVQKSTTASLNFAAVMAVASRIFADYEAQWPGLALTYRTAAIAAYNWAEANPNVMYEQSFSATGEYGDTQFADEFSWAAAELFILTGEANYWSDFTERTRGVSLPGWQNVAALPYISLAFHSESALTGAQKLGIENAIMQFANTVVSQQGSSAYRVPMAESDFNWGSNSNAANYGMMTWQAYRISGEARFKNATIAAVDYLLGRNAVGYSFVTGYGERSPVSPHHRQSQADAVPEPVPGFLVGGPNPGRQDGCPGYIGTQAAKSYVDSYCSYASNEVAINWNAPLVYILGALIAD